jgi:hypothetical protein
MVETDLCMNFKAPPKSDAARLGLNHRDYAKGDVIDYYEELQTRAEVKQRETVVV